jgi:Glycoside hydrolase 131 catalytic N-terminal domain
MLFNNFLPCTLHWQYFQLLGISIPTTPIWDHVPDQPILVLIDNSSVFTPGSGPPQLGFRRSELIAQQSLSGNRTAFDETLESDVTAFHFSVQADTALPLTTTHEYQAVFIEILDGSHIFELQTGTCPAWLGSQRENFFNLLAR